MNPRWLDWAIRLQALAQNGLTYAENPFDVERYAAVRQIAAEMMAAGAQVPVEPVLDLFTQQAGYATPHVDVRGVVFREDALLLVQERSDHCWTLPGGWADPGETPAENVVREIREEAGFETRAERLLAVYDRSRQGHVPPHPFSVFKLFFLCTLLSGQATTSHEIEAVDFFRQDEIPPLSLPRVTPAQIARLFAHRAHPEWPADFD